MPSRSALPCYSRPSHKLSALLTVVLQDLAVLSCCQRRKLSPGKIKGKEGCFSYFFLSKGGESWPRSHKGT